MGAIMAKLTEQILASTVGGAARIAPAVGFTFIEITKYQRMH